MSSYNYCDSNREIRVTQAARLKIIQVHFSGREINMQPFTEMKMELSIRPHAIAWMGRDNSLYQFLRAMPSLLGNGDGKKYIYCKIPFDWRMKMDKKYKGRRTHLAKCRRRLAEGEGLLKRGRMNGGRLW